MADLPQYTPARLLLELEKQLQQQQAEYQALSDAYGMLREQHESLNLLHDTKLATALHQASFLPLGAMAVEVTFGRARNFSASPDLAFAAIDLTLQQLGGEQYCAARENLFASLEAKAAADSFIDDPIGFIAARWQHRNAADDYARTVGKLHDIYGFQKIFNHAEGLLSKDAALHRETAKNTAQRQLQQNNIQQLIAVKAQLSAVAADDRFCNDHISFVGDWTKLSDELAPLLRQQGMPGIKLLQPPAPPL